MKIFFAKFKLITVLHSSAAVCKILQFFASASDFLATWLMVGIALERFTLIKFPQLRSKFCTQRVVKRIILGFTAAAILLNCWIFVAVDLIYSEEIGEIICDVRSEFQKVYQICTFLELFTSCIIPSALVLVFNVAIGRKYREILRSKIC